MLTVSVVTLLLHCVNMANFICSISRKSLCLWCCDVCTRNIADISMKRCI